MSACSKSQQAGRPLLAVFVRLACDAGSTKSFPPHLKCLATRLQHSPAFLTRISTRLFTSRVSTPPNKRFSSSLAAISSEIDAESNEAARLTAELFSLVKQRDGSRSPKRRRKDALDDKAQDSSSPNTPNVAGSENAATPNSNTMFTLPSRSNPVHTIPPPSTYESSKNRLLDLDPSPPSSSSSSTASQPPSPKLPPLPLNPTPWQRQKHALALKHSSSSTTTTTTSPTSHSSSPSLSAAWSPRKRLSPDALSGIRALHAHDPAHYSTPRLASHFKVSAEVIRRILKSKWEPSEAEAEARRKRWERRGERVWEQMNELGLRGGKSWEKKRESNERAEGRRRGGGRWGGGGEDECEYE